MEGIKNADYYANQLGRKAKKSCDMTIIHQKIQEAVGEKKDYAFIYDLTKNQVQELIQLGFSVIETRYSCGANGFRIGF